MLFWNGPTTLFMRVMIGTIALAALSACQQTAPQGESGTPLGAVSPLPEPSVPPYIVDYSPRGEADTLAQIRVIFKDPLIPIERLESPDEQAKLASFHIEPAIAGHFRFLTPRMVGFQADRAIPMATRVRVLVGAGLTDLRNHQLAADFAWTFTTAPVKLSGLPGENNTPDAPLDLNPSLKIISNVELDAASLAAHATLNAKTTGASVGTTAAFEKSATPEPADNAEQTFDASRRDYTYTIKPAQPLQKGMHYTLKIDPGIVPKTGNLASTAAFSGSFSTYGPLSFSMRIADGTQNGKGRFAQGDPSVSFTNGLNAASATKAISIAPAPLPGVKLVDITDGDTSVSLNPYALAPNTHYTVSVASDLKDQFGQTLGESKAATFTTGNLSPDFWAPTGLNIFARATKLRLNYSAVNLPNGRYKASYRALSPVDIAALDSDYLSDDTHLLPPQSAWANAAVKAANNSIAAIDVSVAQKLGAPAGFLAYGVAAQPHDQGSFYGIVGLSNLGVFAQWFPQQSWIAVQHLSDGSPVAHASVEVYRAKTGVPCASAQTGALGIVELTGIDIERCSVNTPPGNAPSLIVIAREGADWSYTRVNDSSGYGYDVYLGWSNGTPTSRGTIFSDRQMYQPGERAMFTGVAYYLQNGALKRDAGATYTLTLRDAQGNVTNLGTKRTDEFGVFSTALTLKSNQPLGYYTVKAVGANGNELTGDVRVAEFKPPNFSVSLSLDKHTATAGQTVLASGKSAYLFGAPLQGGRAHYYVTRAQTTLSPKGWDRYQFGRQWFWPQEAPSVETDVLQADQTLSDAGQGSQAVKVAEDLPFPMTYRVDMEVSDVSNLSVADSSTFTALPSAYTIGLQSDFVGEEHKAFPVKVIVTDANGAVATGQNIHVELQSMEYGAATQAIEGGESARNSVAYTTVAQTDITSGSTPQSVSLTAPKAGSYRIRANFADAKSDASETDTQIWVSGPDPVRWNAENPSQLKIALDKTSYRPGERATALIQSPYPQADLYFSVVREKTLYKTLVKVHGGAPRVSFIVTPEMLPNAAVEAVLVRRGKPLEKLTPGALDSLARIGFAAFSTNVSSKYLKLAIASLHAKVQPGATQSVTLSLKGADGRAARGEFVVMVVNDAILQLTGYRLPDLVNTVYAEQPISTRLSDNRRSVVLSPLTSPLAKGFGYGGGFMEGAGSTRVRRNFQPLAYYNGALRTDATGTAHVSFTLPDDLTTWRVMAVALGGSAQDFRFALGDATFISTKAVLANPLLPQFGRTGDTIDGGVAVTSTASTPGSLRLQGTLTGALRFSDTHSATTQFQEPSAPGTKAYRFPMSVGEPAPTSMQFDASLDGRSDAFSIPFEIRNQAIEESVAQSGATAASATIPLALQGEDGSLDLLLGNSIVPQIVAPAERVLRQDRLPFVESAASRLMLAAALKELATRIQQRTTLDLSAEARSDIAAIAERKRADGGISPWPDAKSDPLVTAYAARALAAAQRAGIPVDAALLGALRPYLAAVLANPGKADWCKTTACKTFLRFSMLTALSDLGDTRSDFIADIYAQRDSLSFSGRARLARYLLALPGWGSAGAALAQKLSENLYLTARNTTANAASEWGWYESPATAQSEMLELLVAHHAPTDQLDNIVRTMSIDHCTCPFVNTYTTAQNVSALLAYVRSQPVPGTFTARAVVGGKVIASAAFAGPSAPAKQIRVAAAGLGKGAARLELNKQGTGTLHYVVNYTYQLRGGQPGALSGLRVTRFVRAANLDPVLLQMGLASDTAKPSLAVSQVFDIGLEVIADHPVDHVMITDPLPAGLEAVDATFKTSTPSLAAKNDSWQIDYQTIYKDRVFAFAERLNPGVYTMHYLVRSVTPGTYAWPGASAYLQFAPEEFGRTASSTLTITP